MAMGMQHHVSLAIWSNGKIVNFATVAVLLSQDVQADTLAQFLEAWLLKLKEFARRVISGMNWPYGTGAAC